MPAARSAVAEAVLTFALGAGLAGGTAAVADAVGHTHFSLPVRLLVPLFAGLGAMGLVATVRDRDWFTHTPAFQYWTGLLGRTGGRVALIVVFVLWLAAAGLLALYPLWGPTPLAPPNDDPPLPRLPDPPEATAGDPDFLAAATRDLRSADRESVHNALHRLGDARNIRERPDDLRAELFKLLAAKQVNPSDVFRAFERWGTLADVPRLEAAADPQQVKPVIQLIRQRELGPGRYALAELTSGDRERAREAAKYLRGVRDDEITDRPPGLVGELLKLVRSKAADSFARSAAAGAVGRFASAADLPALEAAHAELTAARMGDLADDLKSSIDSVRFAAERK